MCCLPLGPFLGGVSKTSNCQSVGGECVVGSNFCVKFKPIWLVMAGQRITCFVYDQEFVSKILDR